MNKKVVVLIVFLECILAVLLVSFFGKVIEETRRDVLCQEIYFVDEDGMKIEDDMPIIIKFDDETPIIRYKLQWKIVAENTTDKTVNVEIDGEGVAYDPGREELVLYVDGFESPVDVTVRVMDGSEKTDTITLIPVKEGGGNIEI